MLIDSEKTGFALQIDGFKVRIDLNLIMLTRLTVGLLLKISRIEKKLAEIVMTKTSF